MSPNFIERVSDRYEQNPLIRELRENERKLHKRDLPDAEVLRAATENIIALPGVFLVFLDALARETSATLRYKTQERTIKSLDGRVRDFMDMDYRDISPITRDLEDWLPVNVECSSFDGISVKKMDYLWPNEQ